MSRNITSRKIRILADAAARESLYLEGVRTHEMSVRTLSMLRAERARIANNLRKMTRRECFYTAACFPAF